MSRLSPRLIVSGSRATAHATGLLMLSVVLSIIAGAARLDAAVGDDDPRGPVAGLGAAPIVSAAGVEAGDASSDAAIAPEDHLWQASWIRPATLGGNGDQLRTTVTLADAPKHVTARMTANSHFKLYVNGRLVARGPVDRGDDYPAGNKQREGSVPIDTGLWFYDVRDLTPFFTRGDNSIAIEVRGGHGALFEAEVTHADGTLTRIDSDAQWRGTALACWDGGRYDAKLDPRGWRGVGFDDSAWPACATMGSEHPVLTLSEIPARMEAELPIAAVVHVTPGLVIPAKTFAPGAGIVVEHDGAFTLRLDRLVSAYVGLRVSGGAGATLRIQGSEQDGGPAVRTMELTLDGAAHAVETPFYDSFMQVSVEATHVTTPLTIEQVKVIFTSLPVHYRGSFSCDDEHLNQVWRACRWNMQMCMQDYHIDSSNHQEPLDGAGDYLIHDGIARYAFGETRLARQDLRKIAHMLERSRYQLFHTSYALYWLHTLIEYYDNTADQALVAELAPTVRGLLERFLGYRGATGLISEAPDYMFMDWVDIAGFPGHHPPAVIGQGYMSALVYQALADAATVARISGHPEQVASYEEARQQLRAAFERELWNADRHRYRDGRPFVTKVPENAWLPKDRDIETFTAQGNSLAVLTGLVPAERCALLMDLVMQDQPLNVQPYFMHFVFGALDHAHQFEVHGTAQLRRWQVDPATGTTRETFSDGDYSHAWQCTPLIQMSLRVLGVSPAAPGWSSVMIAPTLCDLQRAKGEVPTPVGPVAVDWQRDQEGWTCAVGLPGTSTGVLAVPASRFTAPAITLDDVVVWRSYAAVAGASAHAAGDRVELPLSAGRHRITIAGHFLPMPAPAAGP